MSNWIDFVKNVQKRDKTTYSNALRTASGEWKAKKPKTEKMTAQDMKLRKMDKTTRKKKDIQVEKGHRTRKNTAYDD